MVNDAGDIYEFVKPLRFCCAGNNVQTFRVHLNYVFFCVLRELREWQQFCFSLSKWVGGCRLVPRRGAVRIIGFVMDVALNTPLYRTALARGIGLHSTGSVLKGKRTAL